jgi:uncharacterized surface protein with fasciclin (FAS1) repeats
MKIKSLFVAGILATSTLFVACDGGKNNEKAKADSIAAKAKTDSLAKAEADKKTADTPKLQNIAEIAMADSTKFGTLVVAVKAADLAGALSGTDTLTVFAPDNAAFAAVDKVALAALLKDKTKVGDLLKGHIVKGNVKAASLKDGQEVTTLSGKKLKVSIKDGKVMVGGAEVTTADVAASNGTVHVINKVIM